MFIIGRLIIGGVNYVVFSNFRFSTCLHWGVAFEKKNKQCCI